MLRERNIVSQDICECSIPVLALEWCCAVEHFVHQNPQGPPINGTSVSTALDDFWRDVLLGTDKRVCSKVRNASFGIDYRVGAGGTVSAEDHGRNTTSVGLFG